jgi:hypothetical protein
MSACGVAHELMDHREEATRSWRLDVYENGAKSYLRFYSLLSTRRLIICRGAWVEQPGRRHDPTSCRKNHRIGVNSFSRILLQTVEIRLRFGCAFENVRRDAALLQGFAQLHAQKATCSVARHAGIKSIDEAAYCC